MVSDFDDDDDFAIAIDPAVPIKQSASPPAAVEIRLSGWFVVLHPAEGTVKPKEHIWQLVICVHG